MLELVVIFLVAVIVSVTAIWLYRKLTSWQGFEGGLIGRNQPAPRMKVGFQQGFVSLKRKPKRKVSSNRPLKQGAGKTPWGW